MDARSHEVFVDGVKTELTAKEYKPLIFLIQNKGVALMRENILSIAKEILTAHGAKFGVDNRNNCIFWFELPVCPTAGA